MSEQKYWIWSTEHEVWWKPEGKGYTYEITLAGVFDNVDFLRRYEIGHPYPKDIAIPCSALPREDGKELALQAFGLFWAQSFPNIIIPTEDMMRCVNRVVSAYPKQIDQTLKQEKTEALPPGQISYHIPSKYREITKRLPKRDIQHHVYDGHTSADVLKRLEEWIRG